MTSKELFERDLTRKTIQLEDVEETLHSGETEDISSGYERICETIRDLENARDKAVNAMLEEEVESLESVKEWSQEQKQKINKFRDVRRQLKEKLASLEEKELQKRQRREQDQQKFFMEEQAKMAREQLIETEAAKLRQLKLEEEWMQKKLQMERESMQQNREDDARKAQVVKLQKYTITPFRGDHKDWLRFWNQFSVEVDGSNIAEVSKFNYHLELVEGKPKDDVLGLPHTSEGYEEAKRILRITYGKDIKVRKALVIELEGLKPITNINQIKETHEFYNKLARVVRTLATMKKLETVQSHVYTLMDKLGPVKEAMVQKDDNWEEWDLEQLVENLRKYVDRHPLPVEDFASLTRNSYRKQHQETMHEWKRRDKMLMANGYQRTFQRSNGCVYCGKSNHRSTDCFKILDVAHRRAILKKNSMCFNCTGLGHVASKCKSRGCIKCGGRHHTSLCDSSPEDQRNKSEFNQSTEKGLTAMDESTTLHASVVAKVNGVNARIMLDSGAGSSYVCTSLLTQLGIKPLKVEKRAIEQMYGTITKQVEIYPITVESNAVDGFTIDLNCINGEKEILTYLPNPRISNLKKRYNRLRRLTFSDEGNQQERLPVHIIFGAADYQRIKTTEPPVLGPDPNKDPGAEFTMLGWALSGRALHSSFEAEKTFFLKSTRDEFEQMCSLEVLGLVDTPDKREEFHKDFTDKLQRLEDGTYSTRLPWKEDASSLPTNEALAMARLHSTTKRLEKLGRLEEYHSVMKEQLQEGIIEPAPREPTGEVIHYIPHHPVIRDNAESTKMRIVYDCSARQTLKEPCLNDLLETGPSLQPLIFDILLKNRLHKFCLTGDVKKAFLQIKINSKDRDAQPLFWYTDLQQRHEVPYRFTRVIFGSAPSPYILGATLVKHLSQYKKKYPETIKQLMQNTYVDDVQCVADDEKLLFSFKEEGTKIMAEGGFTLHKWHSNIPALQSTVDDQQKMLEETYAKTSFGTSGDETKILGIQWNKSTDTLEINLDKFLKKVDEGTVTKRKMLSAINSVFDPLGIASPVMITGKILYSIACLKKLSWDEVAPEEIKTPWNKWVKSIRSCDSVIIPRSVAHGKDSDITIHGFSDASKSAISVAVYVTLLDKEAVPDHHLLVAKSRIAPKDTTIPRLELIGAHMLSRILDHVMKTLSGYSIRECHGWVDSTTVVHWMKDQGKWSQFVRNRIMAINAINNIHWHYVPTNENPSDLGSRGVDPGKLTDFWFKGPSWLNNRSSWPAQPEIHETSDAQKERIPRAEKQLLIKQMDQGTSYFGGMLTRYSYWKLIRITAYVIRFVEHCCKRKKRNCLQLTSEEADEAEKLWIRKAQQSNNILTNTDLEKGDDGVLRYVGRIPNYKPILLERNHPLVKSLIQACHLKTLHGGVAVTMSKVRERFWIQKLRFIVKKVLHNCNLCKRFRVKPLSNPSKSMLPDFRIELQEPFLVTGVDFAGPVRYRIAKGKIGKAYIALFTCTSTRAVYLKLCKDLTAPVFQRVLKEFVARRGCPKMIVSDNGRTFVATKKWLKTLRKSENLSSYITEQGIQWRFNMSRAPWWGGFFERLVGIMKRSLSKVVGRSTLNFEELEEVLLDVECVTNNRPLCYVGEEFEEPVITPAILLRGKPSSVLEQDIEQLEANDNMTRRLLFIRRSKDQLRKRWMGEYLRALEERQRKHNQKEITIPGVGAVVLLKEDTRNRAYWKLGRIVDYIRGLDGIVRGVKLKLGNGYVVERPLQLICDLEVGGEVGGHTLNPEAPEINPERPNLEEKQRRRAKIIARDQIKSVAVHEEDEH